MREWLLDPKGGNVPDSNLILLLSPHKVGPPDDVVWTEASREDIIRAIEDLLTRSAGQGERFFFHFSGHGLTARINFSNESAIVPEDFEDILPDKTLTLRSLFELFQATQLEEQFFFIDACRNIPFSTEKRLGDYPNPRKPEPPVKPQFIIYATMPGVVAKEVRQPGNEGGAFTNALLAGLRGEGAAKRWDEESGEYVVRWNSLFESVEREIKSRKLIAGTTPDGPLIQEPRQFGERGSENPEFARFSEREFGTETLSVDLRPREVAPTARIDVVEMGGLADGKSPPLPSLPIAFHLPPRSYSVRAWAPGYVPKRRAPIVDLYEAQKLELELEPRPPSSPANLEPAIVEIRGPSRGLGPARKGALRVTCRDPLAYLEVTDNSGRLLKSGRAELLLDTVDPGFYRARLVSPEGDVREELVEMEPGADKTITLTAAPTAGGLLQDIIARAGFPIEPDNTVQTSEAVGPSASLKLSTVLALATAAAMETASPWGHKLRSLGLPPFQELVSADCTNGVQVILADEASPPSTWAPTELRCWRLREPVPQEFDEVAQAATFGTIADTALPRDPGAYWISLRFPSGADVTLPIVVLPKRVSLVVITRDVQGNTDLHQYMLALPAEGGEDPRIRDPMFQASRFTAIRRIELMQRSVASGRITPTWPDVELLLFDKWLDPVAGCLGCYLLVRMGKASELEVPARNLMRYFEALPDGHVLMGAYREQSLKGDPVRAYLDALERGIPIFRDGLALLDAAIKRYQIQHERVKQVQMMLTRVPAGSLWSSIPEALASLETPQTPEPESLSVG
jgi:hypothetical protein